MKCSCCGTRGGQETKRPARFIGDYVLGGRAKRIGIDFHGGRERKFRWQSPGLVKMLRALVTRGRFFSFFFFFFSNFVLFVGISQETCFFLIFFSFNKLCTVWVSDENNSFFLNITLILHTLQNSSFLYFFE